MKLTTTLALLRAVTAFVRGGHPPVWVRGGALHAAPKEIKLYYGDMPFWRAECLRVALFIGDVPFVDVRDEPRDALKAAGKMPFGAVPVLEVDGKILSQTQAMAAYCGSLTKLRPEDPWLAAKCDEAINGCTDVTTTIGATFRLPDEEKIAAREALLAPDGRLTMHLGGLERLIRENGTGYVVGASLSVADLAIWRLAGWLTSGVIDGLPDISTQFPAITRLCALVDAHPKVEEWKMQHPSNYPGANS